MNRQYRLLSAECDQLRDQIAETERQIERLQNTLCAVAREMDDLSVKHVCMSCERSHMLSRNGRLYCPRCGNGQSL